MWEGGSLSHVWEVTREVLGATAGCDEDVSDPHFCTMEGLLVPALSKPFCGAFTHTPQCTSGVQCPALTHAVALQGHSELILLLLPPHEIPDILQMFHGRMSATFLSLDQTEKLWLQWKYLCPLQQVPKSRCLQHRQGWSEGESWSRRNIWAWWLLDLLSLERDPFPAVWKGSTSSSGDEEHWEAPAPLTVPCTKSHLCIWFGGKASEILSCSKISFSEGLQQL